MCHLRHGARRGRVIAASRTSSSQCSNCCITLIHLKSHRIPFILQYSCMSHVSLAYFQQIKSSAKVTAGPHAILNCPPSHATQGHVIADPTSRYRPSRQRPHHHHHSLLRLISPYSTAARLLPLDTSTTTSNLKLSAVHNPLPHANPLARAPRRGGGPGRFSSGRVRRCRVASNRGQQRAC